MINNFWLKFVNEPDFLTIKEFAILIRVHPNTVRRGIRLGHIHAFRIGIGKKSGYRIPRIEINAMAFKDLERVVNGLIDMRQEQKKD